MTNSFEVRLNNSLYEVVNGAANEFLLVSWLRSAQLENASAKGRDRPFYSSVKG